MEILKGAWAQLKKLDFLLASIAVGLAVWYLIIPAIEKAKAKYGKGGGAAGLLIFTLLFGALASDVSAVPAYDFPSIVAPASHSPLAEPPSNIEASGILAAFTPSNHDAALTCASLVVGVICLALMPPVRRKLREFGRSKWFASFAGGATAVALLIALGVGALQTSWARDSVLNFYNRLEIHSGNDISVSTNGVITIWGPSGTNKFSTLTNLQNVASFRGLSVTGWTGIVMATNAAGGVLSNYFWNGLHMGTNGVPPTSWIF